MREMDQFLATLPFDLYELALFRLVVEKRSFTKAASAIGLTQSAVTRQVQGMEGSLGLQLIERTTRSVCPTPAGDFLFREAGRVLGDVDQALRRLREDFAGVRKEVRVGISTTISLAHLPGFFHANLRRSPEVTCRVSSHRGQRILTALEENELDLGVVTLPKRVPRGLKVTHRFADAFALVASADQSDSFRRANRSAKSRTAWLNAQNWLLIDDGSTTGQRLRHWLGRLGWKGDPIMQLDSFDLIINLVALGMGVSFVPVRSLALYGRKRNLVRLELSSRFVRELVLVVRGGGGVPEHVARFVENVLF